VTGRDIAVEDGPRRVGDPAVLVASAARIGKTLGWHPQHSSLETIIGSAWKWETTASPAIEAERNTNPVAQRN
jgi:UDP-glucose 4-epimerase